MAYLERVLAQLEAQRVKLRQQYREEVRTVACYEERRADVELEQLGLKDKPRELEDTRRDLEASLGSLRTWTDQIDRLARRDELVPKEGKHLLRLFADPLLVFKEADGRTRCTIIWTTGYAEEEAT